jgi:hypothetical protein
MPSHLTRGIALAALFSVITAPAVLAGPPTPTPPPTPLPTQEHAANPPQASTAVPDHSVSGVVKFVDRTRLVITRAGKTPVEMTFTVNASTLREGVIAVGAKVQVRFRGDEHPAIATAILATGAHSAGSHRSTSAARP